jgi:hypothetical protein
MFNGYVTPEALPMQKMNYVPLGISDLSKHLPYSPTFRA